MFGFVSAKRKMIFLPYYEYPIYRRDACKSTSSSVSTSSSSDVFPLFFVCWWVIRKSYIILMTDSEVPRCFFNAINICRGNGYPKFSWRMYTKCGPQSHAHMGNLGPRVVFTKYVLIKKKLTSCFHANNNFVAKCYRFQTTGIYQEDT